MKLGPKRIVRDQVGWAGEGQFATSSQFFEDQKDGTTKSRWSLGYAHHCRDRFHPMFTNQNILLGCRAEQQLALATFVGKIEERLKLSEPSRFGPTQRKNIMWVKTSPWWMESYMRRSFFTALLRAAQFYSIERDNVEEALYSVHYFRNTKAAVQRFLEGNTVYREHIKENCRHEDYGWESIFVNRNSKDIKKMLVSPVPKKSIIKKIVGCLMSAEQREAAEITAWAQNQLHPNAVEGRPAN